MENETAHRKCDREIGFCHSREGTGDLREKERRLQSGKTVLSGDAGADHAETP